MIIDIIIVLLVALGAFVGYKKGLIDVLTSIIAIVLALILAFLLQIPVANTLRQSSLGNTLNTTINQGIEKAVNDNESGEQNSSFYSAIVKGILSEEQITTQAENVTMFILKGLSFFIIFIIVTAIIFILKSILNLVFDLPILNSVNKFGGLGLGAIKSLVIVYIILAALAFVSPMPSLSNNITKAINNTTIAKELYNNNLLVKIIESNIK